MKLLLVDDSRLLSEGLQNLLTAHGFEIAGIASNGGEAVRMSEDLKPDLILMDLRMPGHDGLISTRLIKARWPEIKIIILTISDNDNDLFDAIKAGADGYLLKSMSGEDLVSAIKNLEKGISPISPVLTSRVLSEFSKLSTGSNPSSKKSIQPQSQKSALANLTERQIQVLRLVAKGMTYKEIARSLSISERTVRYHMSEMIHRLHLQNRNQVLAYAARLGLDLEP